MSREHWSAEKADLLTGLDESDLAFHESLSAILSCENGVLDPDDADGLALVIVNELPAAYSEGPNLLDALQTCHAFIKSLLNATADEAADFLTNNGESVEDVAFDAITKATGEQS